MTGARSRTAWLALVALLATVVTAACTKGGKDMQTMAPEQATAQVKRYAETVRTAAGVETLNQANENVSPCEGRLGETSDIDKVYYIQGIYQLLIPADQQAAALARVKEQWQRDGHTIKGERSFGGGTGEVGATTADGYTMDLTSGEPPAMLLLVSSPCYRR